MCSFGPPSHDSTPRPRAATPLATTIEAGTFAFSSAGRRNPWLHCALERLRASPARTGTGSGDRTQTLLYPSQGLAGGIRIDGNRHWSGPKGEWDLAITGVEVRLQDPCPQAGKYSLTTPGNKTISLSFSRKSDDVIHVTLAGPKREFSFDVRHTGSFSDS